MQDAWVLPLFVVRAGLNASALLAVGLALHAAFGVAAPKRVVAVAALVALTFAAARLAVVTAQLGDGFGAFLDGTSLSFAWSALGAPTLALAGGALVVAIGAWRSAIIPAALGAVAMAASFALTGHSQDAAGFGLAPAAVAFHVLLAGFWIAAPVTLWPVDDVQDAELQRRMRRFSAVAVSAVPALVLIGVWLAYLLAGGWAGLTGSAYGALLLAKLAAAIAALGLGAFNRQVVTRTVAADAVRGRRLLAQTLAGEAVLFGLAVLAVSAATTFVGPAV
jgi:copper resistance protein D